MCFPGRSEKKLSSYWLQSINSCSSYVEHETVNVALVFTPPQSPVCMDIRSLPLQITDKQGRKKKARISDLRKHASTKQIWSLISGPDITREESDRAAEVLPGFIMGWGNVPDKTGPKNGPVDSCANPALVLGVLARVKDGYYQATCTPDYSIGHLLDTVFICCDDRIPVKQATAAKEDVS